MKSIRFLGAGTTEGSASGRRDHDETSSRKRNSSCCWGHDLRRTQKNLQQRLGSDERRFQKIDVTEPTVKETIEILKGLSGKFEEHHNVVYKRLGHCRCS